MGVTIVGSAGCGACIFTKRAFETAGVPFDVLDVDRDDTLPRSRSTAPLTGSGYGFPWESATTERWTGLRIDGIAYVVRAA